MLKRGPGYRFNKLFPHINLWKIIDLIAKSRKKETSCKMPRYLFEHEVDCFDIDSSGTPPKNAALTIGNSIAVQINKQKSK